MEVLSVETHSRTPPDYYTLIVFLDFLSFLYVAIFYQVIKSSLTLSDIADQRVLPVDYLGYLLVMFGLMIMERVVYSVGSAPGKAVLYLAQLLLVMPRIMGLFWSPGARPATHLHLRLFSVLRLLSLSFSALQLRAGFPPSSSYMEGRGRHSFFFFRGHDMWYMAGFYVFASFPFLYELRALLDWTCTPTTLSLYNWLKMEDIRASIYVQECKLRMQMGRELGDRVPRYLKFLQGALLFGLLLLVLWLPLLVFSSGAPTYQTPEVLDTQLNISITQVGSFPAGGSGVQWRRFPLFQGGDRRSMQAWSGDSPLPHGLSGYGEDQVQLMCVAQDSDTFWPLSPPSRAALADVLSSRSAALLLSWQLMRSAPLATNKGGPACSGVQVVPLSGLSQQQLLEVVRGERAAAQLMAADPHHVNATQPGSPGPLGLYARFWRLRGEMCDMRPGLVAGLDGRSSSREHWEDEMVSCWASLNSDAGNLWWALNCSVVNSTAMPQPPPPPSNRRSHLELTHHDTIHPQTTTTTTTSGTEYTSNESLENMKPAVQPPPPPDQPPPEPSAPGGDDSPGADYDDDGEPQGRASCESSLLGPQLVLLLDRVQSGLLGATLSSFGITGLYVTVVYGVGRFLRLSVTNMRLRIPTEDLPSTTRLVALCQDIYIARAERELALEEELFNVLLNIYRLPKVLFELSKQKTH